MQFEHDYKLITAAVSRILRYKVAELTPGENRSGSVPKKGKSKTT